MADVSRPCIVRVAAGLLTGRGRLLICQRRADGSHPLKWEFPGGKVAGAEGEADCLRRELYEELGIHAMLGDVLHRTTHTYPNGRHVALSFIHVPAYHGRLVNKAFQDFVWETPARLLDYDFLEGDIPFVTHLARGTWRHIFSPLTTIRAKS